jgi:hypothetical protein
MVALSFLVAVLGVLGVVCHPEYFLSNCSRSSEEGALIMQNYAVPLPDRTVVVSRRGENATGLTTYAPNETLWVQLSDTSDSEFLFETWGASFSHGFCNGTRIVGNSSAPVQIIMPASGNVTLKALFASSSLQVYISPTVTLTAGTQMTGAPAGVPSSSPTSISGNYSDIYNNTNEGGDGVQLDAAAVIAATVAGHVALFLGMTIF